MVYFLGILYLILIVFSFYMFSKIFMGKNRSENIALYHFTLGTIFCLAFVFILFYLNSSQYALWAYSLYYIAFTFTMLSLYSFSVAYCNKDSDFSVLKTPFFYFSLVISLFIIINIFHPFVFTLVREPFVINTFWYTYSKYNLLQVMFIIWLTMTAAICINVFSKAKTSPKIYTIRYISIGIITLLHTVYQIVGKVYHFPLWLESIFIVPFGGILLYFTIYYSDRAFKQNALLYVADSLSDGFILYGEDNRLIYANNKLKSLVSEAELNSFNHKDAFDAWINDATNLNGFLTKKVTCEGRDYYFSVVSHLFSEKQAYVGTSYNLQDITTTIERLEAVEAANAELAAAARMKSDFLANMSHEIRTPMNAVIGMAEMAMREDMTDDARDYISQIKSSGRALLSIINDILDFSKIESGKMEIIPEEYALLSEINDVANTLITRIGDKDIELTVEQNPSLPTKLYGDVSRIRQILINLANNAIKFTEHGRVQIVIDYEVMSDDEIMLYINIEDTGIGIKPEDKQKLFTSFQQVDTKRNRTIEGTGLGLAISKNLVLAMNGSIDVDSEYGVGSDFHFCIPQKVIDWTPSIIVEYPEDIFVFGMWNKKHLANRFFNDTNHIRVFSAVLKSPSDYDAAAELYEDKISEHRQYLFFEEADYNQEVKDLLVKHPYMIGVMLADYTSLFKSDIPNLRVFRKPLSTLSIALALNNMEMHNNNEESKAFESDFTAPNAKILIVDDNAINITIAEGLLSPLQMQIDSALSGNIALDMVSRTNYDIVFMDHMMPGMDGVETTKHIRQTMPHLNNMPIIALSANAISGVKEYFIESGMNDFIPKPIEVRDIISKVKQWLPESMIQKNTHTCGIDQGNEDIIPELEGIDIKEAIRMLGSYTVYKRVLKQYFDNIDDNYAQIKEQFDNEDWANYTIKVHALKSSSRQIGAMELGDMAYVLEMAGHDGDVELIKNATADVLNKYLELKQILGPVFEVESETIVLNEVSNQTVIDTLTGLKDACDNLDMDTMEENMSKLETYALNQDILAYIKDLRIAVNNMDVDACIEIADNMLNLL